MKNNISSAIESDKDVKQNLLIYKKTLFLETTQYLYYKSHG